MVINGKKDEPQIILFVDRHPLLAATRIHLKPLKFGVFYPLKIWYTWIVNVSVLKSPSITQI
jgi:hypothetical protein